MQKMTITKIVPLIALLGLCSFLFAQEINVGLEFDAIPPTRYDTAKADGWVVLFDGTHEILPRLWWLGPGHGGEGRWWIATDPETQTGGGIWNHTHEALGLW